MRSPPTSPPTAAGEPRGRRRPHRSGTGAADRSVDLLALEHEQGLLVAAEPALVQDGRSTTKEIELAEQREQRSARRKLEIVLAEENRRPKGAGLQGSG